VADNRCLFSRLALSSVKRFCRLPCGAAYRCAGRWFDIACAASWTAISSRVVIISNKNLPPLGLAHLTVLEVPPLELITLAASIGYAFVGLRLHPAFSGAPSYKIPPGSPEMREMRRRMNGEGVSVYDIPGRNHPGSAIRAPGSGLRATAPAGVAGGIAGTYRHFRRGPNAGCGASHATRTTNLRGDNAPFRIL
jgi:hypothetical protein